MSRIKRSSREKAKSLRQSKASISSESSSSDSESLGPSSLLSDLRSSGIKSNNALLCWKSQAAVGTVILAAAAYFILEPGMALITGSKSSPWEQRPATFRARVGYVLLNSCFSLVWLMVMELYKECLRMRSYCRPNSEMSLEQQIRLNGRIKVAERMHIRGLSQLFLFLVSQLVLAADVDLAPFLDRVAPTFNCLYLLARLMDTCQPKRLQILSMLIVHVPLFACLFINIQRHLFKLLWELTE